MLNDRVLSGNVNIGIGLMLESLFKVSDRYDNKREIPNMVDINKYDYHIYNIITFIRNIIQSYQDRSKIKEKDIINILIDEINYIYNTYYSNIDTEMMLLIPDYTKLKKELNANKEFNLTKADTELIDILDFVKELDKDSLKGLQIKILKIDKPQKYNTKILLTSSFLLDMLLLGTCDLLESHTGVLKNRHKLNSKYATIGKRDLSHLPYNKTLHILLGDKTLIKPVGIGTRVEIFNISIEKKWNTHTSEEKILQSVKNFLPNKK